MPLITDKRTNNIILFNVCPPIILPWCWIVIFLASYSHSKGSDTYTVQPQAQVKPRIMSSFLIIMLMFENRHYERRVSCPKSLVHQSVFFLYTNLNWNEKSAWWCVAPNHNHSYLSELYFVRYRSCNKRENRENTNNHLTPYEQVRGAAICHDWLESVWLRSGAALSDCL